MRVPLMICGHGRHGKDTVADMFKLYGGYTAIGSSMALARHFYEAHRGEYESVEQCFEDRHNRRADWYNFVREYNSGDLTRLAREIFKAGEIYVGIRSIDEFQAAKDQGLFGLSIWVDASSRVPPEDSSSCSVTASDCDIIIDNNSHEMVTAMKVMRLCAAIGARA